jgi:GTPase Era involved in 16S rRNA processing
VPAPTPNSPSETPSNGSGAAVRASLNESHIRHLKSNFEYADKLLSEMEEVLTAAASRSVFPQYIPDVSHAQAKVVEDYIARIRSQLIRVLASFRIDPSPPKFGSIHAIRVHLSFVRIAIQESAPRYLAGYGPVPPSLVPELNGLTSELEGLVSRLDEFLAQGTGHDLQGRLARLAAAGADVELLGKLERVVTEHGLVEFRATLESIVERLANVRFEIAVFGQVSSGKSSLLNHVLGTDVLPVGVNPITAIPTRIVYGTSAGVSVQFAHGRCERFPLAQLPEFVSEQHNPGNERCVVRIIVEIPSPRLAEGIVFVDTPGLGSLATAGAAETRAYLPQCDLGVVLVNAGSTLSPEDIATIQSLFSVGIPPAVLLSKADLLNAEDRGRAVAYIAKKLREELSTELAVYPVSVVGDHEHLLQAWFSDQILPLFSEQQKLAQQSIQRKIGVLRESVIAALKAGMPAGGNVPAGPVREDLEAADQQLRAAAGELPNVEKLCFDKTDAIRELGPVAIAWAANRLFEGWKAGKPLRVSDVIRSALIETAAEDAARVFSALSDLAQHLARALQTAATLLGAAETATSVEFETVLREMPQMETSGLYVEMSRPFAVHLGRALATRVIEHRLTEQIGRQVRDAYVSYARVLQAWFRGTLSSLSRIFDSRADGYRAQMERLLSPAEASEDRAAIERDLRLLEYAQPEPAAKVEHSEVAR